MFKHQLRALQTKSLWLCAAAAMLSVAGGTSQAALLYSTGFNSPTYSPGGLIGQDGWVNNSGLASNPQTVVQVLGDGSVTLTTSGEDNNRPFTPAATNGSIYLSADITVNTAQATGDYFLHLGDGGGSALNARIYAKSTTGGFLMALGTGAGTPTYGTTVLNLGTTYHILAQYNFVSGATNDTGALFINPANPLGVGDTAYVAATTIGTDATSLSAVYMRQGTAANAAGVKIDNIAVNAVAAVPEPASLALASIGLGLVGLFAARRK